MMGSKSDQFINDLVQFYRNKGHNNPQPQQFIARINGKVVDLNELYSYVIESGGSFKVNQLNLWDEIYCKLFKTNVVGANISVALRQIYNRYLLPYEKVFSTNFNNDLLDDDDEESNFSFNSSHNHNHNHSFNSQNSSFSVPSISYQIPQTVSITTGTETRNPLNKLLCSLLSGLPNELDFALKVSTILINSNRFDWNSDHKFVDLLLECSKNYCCVCDQRNDSVFQDFDVDCSELFTNDEQNLCNCYQRFWYQCCSDEQTLELAFGSPDPTIEELPEQDFNKIEEKVRLIGDIIRNLSFTYDSDSESGLPAGCVASAPLMRFLLLLSNSSLQPFNYIAFDIISNIATLTAVTTEDNNYKQIQQNLHRRCVQIAMTSNDIHWTSRSLEIISRLLSSNNEEITSFVESQLRDYEVFIRITHLMTCQYDISLLLAILEFCLSLSQQRPYLLVKEDNKHLIKMLLTLLNCEASQHFTTTALKKMRVIDDRPRTQANQSSESSGQTVSVVTSGQNTSSQTTNLDNETFAMNWLRSTYEPIVNLSETQSSLKASDVYADYVKQCCRSSRRNVMAAQPFSQLIKRCFPSSSLTNNQTTIEGIVAKSVQNIPNKSNGIPAPLLMSPILKAHLSAPPKNSSSTTPAVKTNTNSNTNLIINNTTNTTSIQSIGSTTCLTLTSNSLSIPTTNTSTLIKSLLANKLRSNAIITTSTTNLGTTLTTTTTVTPPTSTTVTPTKSTNNMSVKVTPVAKPVPITNTTLNANNSGISETNGESIGNNSPQLPSAITITPSVSSVSLTPNNTIISTNATLTGQTIQPQQQFLLVRTIITSPGQQQSGSSLTTSGTPVRLILPASMLTQQRLNPPTVNGITTTSNTLTNVALSASNSLTANNSSTTVSSNTSDIFLKTVLSNSNSSTNSVTPLRSNVKSSPLLNVLLDKGKLPEFSTTAVINNQVTGIGNSGATLMTPQTPKMYILTTKSPLAIKSLPTIQTQQLNQTTQCIPQTQLSPVCTPLQTQNTTLKACLQNSSVVMATTTVNSITVTTTTTANHSVFKQSPPKACVTPLVNGDIGPVVHSTNVVNSVTPINSTNSVSSINAVNCVSDSNSGQTVINTLNPIHNSIPSSDLSSFKEIKKAVDDATRLLAKRPNENADTIGSNKKLKINSVLTIPSSGVSAHNSLSNHDSNSDSIPNNPTNNLQQVLTKASTVSTTPSTLATTITTITSNNIKSVCNTNNNISNKENDSSVNSEFECQWNDCKKTFSRASEVFLHVHNHHIMPSTFPNIMTCLWGGQEGTGPGCLSKRPKFSLLTHLLDFHCNPNVLQQESVRKKQLSSVGSTAIALPQPPAHPGYAHNAALLAIKRHATNYVEAPTLPPVNELTPLTVSIRLTCALILRNLTLHSNFVKRTLECFEQYLCELCMSDGRDESRTIAQCLALINDKT